MKIRLIPMSLYDAEFTNMNIKDVQEKFFKNTLINESKCWYYYGKNGLEANQGDLLLFQMDNNIIASAILEDIIKFLRPTPDGNMGALVLEQKTIKTFKPINKIELQEYIPSFNAFNQTKQKFSIEEVNIENLNKMMNIND